MAKPIPCIGIDTGTTNLCIVSLVNGGVPTVVKSPHGDSLHASAIFYPENINDEILIGRKALAKHPHHNLIIQPKRAFGISLAVAKKKGLINTFNAKVAVGPFYKDDAVNKDGAAKTTKKRGGKSTNKKEPPKIPDEQIGVKFLVTQDGVEKEIPAEKVTEDLMRKFVEIVQTLYGEEVCYVFSRPQNWDTNRAEQFKTAVKAAIGPKGKLEAIITEPNAAQFSYMANDGRTDDKRRLFVLDLGGGTFDLSYLVEVAPGIYQGVCTGGSDSLGGANVERDFLRALETEMKEIPSFKPAIFKQRQTDFLLQLKDLKHNLSLSDSAQIVVYGCTEEPFTFSIDKEKKKVILQEFYKAIDKTIDVCFELKVKGTEKTAEQLKGSVERCYLVGGAMRDEFLSEEVFAKKFPNADIIGKPGTKGARNPDEVVAEGCALWCAAKSEVPTKISLPPDPKHRDVVNKSIGIAGIETGPKGDVKKFCVIVPANTELPTCQGREGFPTYHDNQTSVHIEVFQGEGELINSEDVEPIGDFRVLLETPNKVDEISVDVEIEVSIENTLVVRAGPPGKLEEQKFRYNN